MDNDSELAGLGHALGWSWLPAVAAIALGTVFFVIATLEVPYNIDELRQTRSYYSDLSQVVELSYDQQQPPLDPVLNALAQRLIGVGDLQQRALSVLFGVGSLAVIGLLISRTRLGTDGAAVGILVLATSPPLISVMAYARPYSLPLFLILLFLFSTDTWLKHGRLSSAIVLVTTALLLPLSRTAEPGIALVSSIIVLVIYRLRGRIDWKGSASLPISAAAASLSLVAVPTLLRLQTELGSSTIAGLARWGGLTRLMTEIPATLVEAFSPWPIVLALAVLSAATPRSRSVLRDAWWFWILACVAIGFTLLFVLRTPADQTFYSRYTFSWWPFYAVTVAALVSTSNETRSTRPRWQRIASTILFTLVILTFTGRVVADLTAPQTTDWKALSHAINNSAPEGATVLFETPRPLGEYRTLFAGRQRYLDAEHHAPHMTRIIQRPDTISDSAPIVVALLDYADDVPGWPIDVAEWHRFDTGTDASIFLPTQEFSGRQGARNALLQFSAAFDADRGAAMALAAAALAADDGDTASACQIVDGLNAKADESLVRRIDKTLTRGSYGSWGAKCGQSD